MIRWLMAAVVVAGLGLCGAQEKSGDAVADGDAEKAGERKRDAQKKPAGEGVQKLGPRVTVGTGHAMAEFTDPTTSGAVDARVMRLLGADSADALLEWVAGVDVQNGGMLTEKSRINMRGLPGNYGCQRVLVMLDDVPLNEQYLGDVDFRFIPDGAVEKVEVLRGTASALYGGSAMAGAIKLRTYNPRHLPLLRVDNRTGSHGLERYDVLHARSFRRVRYLVFGSYAATDGYLTNADGTLRGFERSAGLAKMELLLDSRYHLDLLTMASRGRGQQDAFLQETSRGVHSAALRTTLDEKQTFDFSLMLYQNGLDNTYSWKGVPGPGRTSGDYHQSTGGTRMTLVLRRAQHNVTIGFEHAANSVDVKELSGRVEQTERTSSAFAQYMWKWGPVTLIGGVRYDDHSTFGGEISPRVAVSYRLPWQPETVLRAAAGRSYRPPSISDLYLPVTYYGFGYFQGNPGLDAEHAWIYEIGSRHKRTLYRRAKGAPMTLRKDLTIFFVDARDFFDYTVVGTIGSDPLFEPRNFTRISALGGELQVRLENLLPGLHLLLNYTCTDSVFKEYPTDPTVEENSVPYIPRNYGTAGVVWQPDDGTSLMLYCRASDHRNTDVHNYKVLNLHSYAVFGFRARSEVYRSHATGIRGELHMGVDNITDKRYQQYRGVPMPGRTLFCGFRLEF